MPTINYKKELLKIVSIEEVNEWLVRNPVPGNWKGDKYSYAYTEMPIGWFWTWYRRNILGYNILVK